MTTTVVESARAVSQTVDSELAAASVPDKAVSSSAEPPPSAMPAAAVKPDEFVAPLGADAAGKKRAAPAGEGKGDIKRRRADFLLGDRGVFFTAMAPSVSANARRDLFRLLDNAASEPVAAKTHVDGTSASDKLNAELKELKDNAKAPRFVGVDNAFPKGTGLIKFAQEGDIPSKIIPKLLETQKAQFQATNVAPSSRLLCRVLPIDHTCKPHIEDFKKLAEAVLPPHLGPEAPPTVWGVEFKSRNMSTLKKEPVIAVIDAIVKTGPPGRHKVNITNPEKCILIEVNPLFCGLTVVERWADLKKYNLHALTTEESDKKLVSSSVVAASAPAASPGIASSATLTASATAGPDALLPDAADTAVTIADTSVAASSPSPTDGNAAKA